MSDDVFAELVEIIQSEDEYPEVYQLLLVTFMNAKEQGETDRMALALAKKEISD